MEINVAEYRDSDEGDNTLRKIAGTCELLGITLKREVIESEIIYHWLQEVRTGDRDNALRTVSIHLQAEDRSGSVQSRWLSGARPIKYTGPALNANGTDMAAEELVLAYESLRLVLNSGNYSD